MFAAVAGNSTKIRLVTDIPHYYHRQKRKDLPEKHLLEALFLRADFAGPLGLFLDKMDLEETTAVTAENIELLRHC